MPTLDDTLTIDILMVQDSKNLTNLEKHQLGIGIIGCKLNGLVIRIKKAF